MSYFRDRRRRGMGADEGFTAGDGSAAASASVTGSGTLTDQEAFARAVGVPPPLTLVHESVNVSESGIGVTGAPTSNSSGAAGSAFVPPAQRVPCSTLTNILGENLAQPGVNCIADASSFPTIPVAIGVGVFLLLMMSGKKKRR